jgi:hypothetical protein
MAPRGDAGRFFGVRTMTEGNVMSDEEKTAALRKAPVPLFTNQGFPLRPLFDVNGCPIVKNWTEQPE